MFNQNQKVMTVEIELYKENGKYYGYLTNTEYGSGWKTDGHSTKEECVEQLKDYLLEEFYNGEEEGLTI